MSIYTIRLITLACASALFLLPIGTNASGLNLLSQPPDDRPRWTTRLDGVVSFYLETELGVLVAGTPKSVYAVDSESGDVLWRRKNVRLDESDVSVVPGTDLVLFSFEDGDKTRLEAVDVLTGDRVWRTEKERGRVMQLAVDSDQRWLAVVFVRDARGGAREGFKRKPVIHVFDLNDGDELWERKLESDIEMLPAKWNNGDSTYTLENYRPPVFVGDRLYVFYEGITSLDAMSGQERKREKFRVNEEGLALTEADPVFDEENIYASGRGRIRAISRSTGEEIWEAKDLGVTPELVLAGDVLFARTGGQFLRIKDGETVDRGPYGVSAINRRTGKVLWRYKGADKGITNLAFPNSSTILIADRDDLLILDTANGKRRSKVTHGVERAAFVLINESGNAVVGGQNAIAALEFNTGRKLWFVKHPPPGRGVLRVVAAVAARAAALYFRYGGVATAFFRGAQLASGLDGLRSGLRMRVSLRSLQSLAADSARGQIRGPFRAFGIASGLNSPASVIGGYRDSRILRGPRVASRVNDEVEDRLLDRLDPSNQLDRLSNYLLRRRRLAALRGQWMYFYTNLPGGLGKGLAGVNLNNGRTDRTISLEDPDPSFVIDELSGLMHTARNDRMIALRIND